MTIIHNIQLDTGRVGHTRSPATPQAPTRPARLRSESWLLTDPDTPPIRVSVNGGPWQ